MKRIWILVFVFWSFISFSQQYILKLPKNQNIPSFVSVDFVGEDFVIGYIWGEGNLQKIKEIYPNVEILKNYSIAKVIEMASTLAEMSNWDRYPTYDLYITMMQNFANKFPNITKLDTIGYTQQGRLLLAIKISDNPNKQEFEPQFFYTSTMHGDETAGYVILLRLIDYLLNNYLKDSLITYLINNYEIYINPLANPDGTYYGGNYTVTGAIRYYANGVDPNRDFYPVPTDLTSQSTSPETKAMQAYAANHNFIMSANLHGGAEVYNYPWDVWTTAQNPHADDQWFQTIGSRFVQTARQVDPYYMTSVTASGVTEGGDWYVVQGSRQDYMNFVHHCREVTLEISNTKLLGSDQLPTYWNILHKALINYILEAERGIQGIVLDSLGKPQKVQIYIANYDKDSSQVYTNQMGYYFRPILPGSYRVQILKDGNLLIDSLLEVNDGRNFVSIVPDSSVDVVFKVIDTSGKDLTDIEILVNNDNQSLSLITDVQGEAVAKLGLGVYKVEVGGKLVIYEAVVSPDTFVYVMPNYETVSQVDKREMVKVYPNPVFDELKFSDVVEFVEVYDLFGRKIYQSAGVNYIDVSSFDKGVYLLRFKVGNNFEVVKFIKL